MNGPYTRVLLLISAYFGAWGAESLSAESACSLSGDRLWFDTWNLKGLGWRLDWFEGEWESNTDDWMTAARSWALMLSLWN